MMHEYGASSLVDEFFGMDSSFIKNEKEQQVLSNFMDIFNFKFRSLLDYYDVSSRNKLYGFLIKNEDMFVLLEDIKPILEKFFLNKKFVIKIIEDPEINNDIRLVVYIQLNYSEEDLDEVLNKLNRINSKIRPIKRRLNLLNNFLVDVVCL